jgi:ketosteroid isomerase-like protein
LTVRHFQRVMLIAASCAVAVSLAGTPANAQSATISAPVDSAAALAAVESFHRAIVRGDSAAAVALLAADVVVLESGDLETRKEYLGHHLGADMAFAKAVPEQRTLRSVTVAGDAAWIVSTNRTVGTFQGRAIDSEGAELIVLRKTNGKWTIAAIHWSSHRKRAQ